MKKIIALFLCFGILMSLNSCRKAEVSQSSSSVSQGPYTVVDIRGKEVKFEKPPTKIVTLSPSNTEIAYSLDLSEQIIAVSKYCTFPADTANKQKLDTGATMNIEEIIKLNPDLVIISQMDQTDEQLAQLETAGIKIIVTNIYSIEDTYNMIDMIGRATGKSAEAAVVIGDMKADFEEIKTHVTGKEAKRVYIEISPLQYGLWTCGKGSFQDEILTLMGAENIFSDVDDYKEVTEEQVISRNPQFIFTTVGDAEGISDPIAEIKSRANWDKIDAVKNSNVYLLSNNALTIPGPRLSQAAKQMARYIYGIII